LTNQRQAQRICIVLDNLSPHEALTVARKRLEMDQATAARRVGLGLHDYVAIERGRLSPSAATHEGAKVAAAIEREFGIPASAWTAEQHVEAASA